MKPAQVVCISLMLAGTMILAQFVSVRAANQASGLAFAQGLQHGLPANSSHISQKGAFAQTGFAKTEVRTSLALHSRRVRVTPQAQTGPEQVLYAFQGSPDGNDPNGGLIFDSKGNLYGATQYGGSGSCSLGELSLGCGTVFELSPSGSGGWSETVLYAFQGGAGGGADGWYPGGPLIFDSKGNLYGATVYGGSTSGLCGTYGCGTIFELSPNGNGGWTETILYRFQGGADGSNPNGGLIFDQAGNLFGTTATGGGGSHCYWNTPGCGTVFELSPNGGGGWTEKVLYSFGVTSSDGNTPNSPLIFDGAGNLFGTTPYGGGTGCSYYNIPGCGTVFELSPNGAGGWKETFLYAFQGDPDGQEPEAGLIFDQKGNLYGTTFGGGESDCGSLNQIYCGTVFEFSPNGSGSWTEFILYRFESGTGSSFGTNPSTSLVFDQSGNLYGTTTNGYGNDFYGTVFELAPAEGGGWTETTLYVLQGGSDGRSPSSGLILDPAGNLYGETNLGGDINCGGGNGCGTIYEVSKVAVATLSPASLGFGDQTPGASSSPQAVTVTNSGRLPLTITSIGITGANSGDFGQTNNCLSSLSQGDSCKVSVTFTPTAGGNRAAALQLTDNAPGSPQGVSLSGTGEDFSLSVTSQTSQTVTPGQAANYAIAVAPVDGFSQKVALSCSGAPPQSTCTVTPSSVRLNGTSSAPANVAVVTTGASASLVSPAGFPPGGFRLALWLAFAGLPRGMLLGSRPGKRRGPAVYGLLLLCVLCVAMTWTACGGGSSSTGNGGNGGTPTGTYTLTVTGTFSSGSANLVHSTKLTLVVQ